MDLISGGLSTVTWSTDMPSLSVYSLDEEKWLRKDDPELAHTDANTNSDHVQELFSIFDH